MSWPKECLASLGTVVTGSTPRTSEDAFYNGDIPFVTPTELDQGEPTTVTSRTLTRTGAASVRVVPEGAVMVSCIGSLGKVGIAGRPLATNQQINTVVFKTDRVWPKYGYYACQTLRNQLECMAPATTLPIVSKSKFEMLRIPVPPIDEQRRIAAILDQADDLRRKRRLALAKLNELPQAIFHEMFGDPIDNPHDYHTVGLESLIDNVRGISYGIVQRGLDQPEGVNVLRISDIDGDQVNTTEIKKTLPSIASKYKRTLLRGGEIIISIRGTIGRCAIVPESLVGSNVSRELAVIPIINSVMSSHFLLALLRSAPVQRRLTRDVKGVAQSGINLEDLRRLPIIQPSPEQIATFLDALEMQRNVADKTRASLDRSEQLFASLQHHAFAGTLNPSSAAATLASLQLINPATPLAV